MEGFVEVETPRPRRAALRDRVELRLARSAVLAVLLVGGVLVASAFVLGYATGRFLEPEGADDPFYVAAYAPPPAPPEGSARAPLAPSRPPARPARTRSEAPKPPPPSVSAPVAAVAVTSSASTPPAAPRTASTETPPPVAPSPVAAAEPPPSPPRIPLIETAPERGYGVQLGAFESRAEAEGFVETHAGALSELPVHLLPAEVPGRGVWWRVRVGLAPSRGKADRIRKAMPASLAAAALVVSYR